MRGTLLEKVVHGSDEELDDECEANGSRKSGEHMPQDRVCAINTAVNKLLGRVKTIPSESLFTSFFRCYRQFMDHFENLCSRSSEFSHILKVHFFTDTLILHQRSRTSGQTYCNSLKRRAHSTEGLLWYCGLKFQTKNINQSMLPKTAHLCRPTPLILYRSQDNLLKKVLKTRKQMSSHASAISCLSRFFIQQLQSRIY